MISEEFINKKVLDSVLSLLESGYDKSYRDLSLNTCYHTEHIACSQEGRDILDAYGIPNAVDTVEEWVEAHRGKVGKNRADDLRSLTEDLWCVLIDTLVNASNIMADAFDYLDTLVDKDGRKDEFPDGVWESDATLDMNVVLIDWLKEYRSHYGY